MSYEPDFHKISHKTYFWIGVVIWIVLMLTGPVKDYPWYTGFLMFPLCWIGAYALVFRCQNDVAWSEKTNWKDDPFNTKQ
jgi:hypothetical protein